MKKVKYRCIKCGYSELPTKKDNFVYLVVFFFFTLGFVLSSSFIILYFFGENIITIIAENSVEEGFESFARANDYELREIALNFTSECDTSGSYCRAYYIYLELEKLHFVLPSKYKILYYPQYTLDNGGDCKNLAILYYSLLNSVGIENEIICSYTYNHCINKVPITSFTVGEEWSEYIIVDLANDEFIIANRTEDIWEAWEEVIY